MLQFCNILLFIKFSDFCAILSAFETFFYSIFFDVLAALVVNCKLAPVYVTK
jgi:hypothetical protein